MINTPFDNIRKTLSDYVPEDLIRFLPEKWEKIGDVLIVKWNPALNNFKEKIFENYSQELNVKTILNDKGISGEFRLPNMEVLWGLNSTETTHKENGIRYKLDPQKVMFSSGNMSERIRMSKIKVQSEVIVDLFAGIGYFTLPIAFYGRPKKIFSCEINPESYDYLCDNVSLNRVNHLVEPILGDNREVSPKNVADRVIMGYIGETKTFLPTAIETLKNKSGIIHYHDTFPDDKVSDCKNEIINYIECEYERKVILLNCINVKSYAPGVGHYVLDLKLVKNE